MLFQTIESDDQSTITREALERALHADTHSFITARLRGGTFASARYPYLHVSAPKCACTKTKMMLWELEELGPFPADIHDRPPGDQRLSALTVTRDRAMELLFGNSVFRFRVHRDPVRRLISAYVDKIVRGRWAAVRGALEAFTRQFGWPPETTVSFDQFAEFVCAQPDHQRDQHWMSQWRLTLSEAIRYSFTVRVDHYARDMAHVYDRLGVPRRKWPTFDSKENASGSEQPSVSQATQDMIRRAYEKDCDPPPVVAHEGGMSSVR